MPITLPAASTKGPPEKPGFSLASVAIAFSMAVPCMCLSEASGFVIMPVVAVGVCLLNGLASAIINCPVFSLAESPSSIGLKLPWLVFSSAMSLYGSVPITVAV